jgi:GT2 family glycosyltransferase
MKKIAIIIPIHNRLHTTQGGLNALCKTLAYYSERGKGKFKYETIVVDDGSTDGSSEWIGENFPGIHLLKGDGNLWWTGAINMGAKYALETLNADYILLWNDDIAPADNFFAVAEDNLLQFDNNTIFGAKIIDSNYPGTVLSCGGFFNKYSGVETIIKEDNFKKYSQSRFISVASLTGMGTFIHKDVINAVGFWDKYLPHYKSDSDYILTLNEKGYHIIADQELIIMDDATKRGVPKPKSVREFLGNLTSVRSPYNLKFLTRYNRKHGIAPFSYYGIVKVVVPVFLGIVKRSILP